MFNLKFKGWFRGRGGVLGLVAIGLALAGPLAVAADAFKLPFPPAPEAAEASGLRADPAVVLGELPNGLRYAIRFNPEPRERVILRLAVAAGSLHEEENQRGLAHFLEHMAFNGSRNFPPGTLIEFFQRMGMDFGGHTNAYTSFDRTVYKLDLADPRPATLVEGLRVLADYADGLLLAPEEIERERGVVLSEKLSRDSADYRALVASYGFFYGETRLPARLPIGEEAVLRGAGREAFLDYYDTWYRPSRMAVIVVGDVDPAAVEPLVREAFSGFAPRAPERPDPDLGGPRASEDSGPKLVFGYHYEPEASSTAVTFVAIRPCPGEPDTAARRLRELPRELAFSILNRRLAELAKAEEAPFVSASATGNNAFRGAFEGASLRLVARPGKWAETLRVGENELRRARLHGFTAAELREAVATVRNALEQAVATDATRHSAQRADDLIEAFLDGEVPTTPADDLALLGPALDAITTGDCHAAFVAAWETVGGLRVGVFGNTRLGEHGEAAAALSLAYAAAEAVPVAAPEERADAPWAYEDFGSAGVVTERREVEDLGITLVTFANGVRLNIKRTDFEAGVAYVRARVGTGQLTEPRDRPGLAHFAGAAFTAGGLGRHSADELRRVLAGRNVGVGLQVADDAVILSGRTTPADLTLQFQLLAASLVDPGWRAEGEQMAHRQLEPFFNRLLTQPAGVLQMEVPRILAAGDFRFGLPRREESAARNFAELREWLGPQLATGPLEIGVVGDVEVEAVIRAAAATVGALPAREERPELEDLRRVGAAQPGTIELTYSGAIPKSVLAVYWPAGDAREASRARRVTLLAEILNDRLRDEVREKIGGSYSPGAGAALSDTYRDRGFIIARVETDPAELERVRATMRATVAELAAEGPTEDEVTRARLPLLTSVRESERTNVYWLNVVVSSAQEQPWRLDWARTRRAEFESIPRDDLVKLAKEILPLERAIEFVIRPADETAAGAGAAR